MGKIIVIGDSIAYGKWDSEGGWVYRLRKHIDTNYNIGKGGNYQVYNLGIPGEVAIHQVTRFENEISIRLTQDDTTYSVIIAVGINDSCPNNWMTQMQTPEQLYKEAFEKMIDIAKQKGCNIGVIGLTPVKPIKSKKLLFTNEEVRKYDGYITEVCKAKEVPKLELFDDLSQSNYVDMLVDVVHPNDEGHTILFNNILQFLELYSIIKIPEAVEVEG